MHEDYIPDALATAAVIAAKQLAENHGVEMKSMIVLLDLGEEGTTAAMHFDRDPANPKQELLTELLVQAKVVADELDLPLFFAPLRQG